MRGPWTAMWALCACFFMIMLDSTIVTVAIPAMLTGLEANLNEVVWVNSVYLLANTVPLLLTGRLGDRYGPKRVLVVGLVIFTGASLWCGLATSPGMLIAARAVQGLGAAAMTPQTLSFITRLFPPEKRGLPISVWGAVAGVATITGPVIGGLLVENVGWEWIFLINLPIGVASLVIAVVALPDWQPHRALRFDALGAALCSLGLLLLVFGVQNGQHYHWGPAFGPVTVVHLIIAGLVLLALFAWRQVRFRRAETAGPTGVEPLVPNALFTGSEAAGTFGAANLTHAALGFATTGMFLPLVLYLQTVLGLSPLASSVLALPMAVAAGITAIAVGAVWAWVGARTLIMSGLLTLAAGTGFLAWLAEPETDPVALIPGLVVAGVGIGCVFAPLTAAATARVPAEMVGAASGVFNTSRQVGGVLGSAAVGMVLQVGVAFAVPDAARQYAERLPPRYREEFVDRVTDAANTASQFDSTAPPVPSNLDPDVADIVRRIVTEVFHDGFTIAAKASLVLPIAVLVLGVLAAAGIRLPRLTRTAHESARGLDHRVRSRADQGDLRGTVTAPNHNQPEIRTIRRNATNTFDPGEAD
ncbi:DHA2 family efflux MFS transporter permease subunit [Actinophytocola sp.]|uniref:DHA2 family efflux MFS transporter permease subunit n=1 Tax=Actinophytocola sp. TaxID=1872138 RepID=UPI003D6B2194